ncbi:hypothetical protein Q7P35_011366 [Cladosporium inversicolor]
MAPDRPQRSRRPLYAPPSTSRQQSTLGYWVPLITISTIAIGGLAAWIWSERSDSDEDDRHDRPPRPATGQGGAYPTQGAQPYPGPPGSHPTGQDGGMPPYQGPIPSQAAGPQGVPPPVGGEAASYYTGRSATHTEQQQQQRQNDDASWYGQVRGAIRRTPSPQQFFDSASKQMGAAAAAAGAALGSIIEEDKDKDFYYEDGNRRRGREGEGEVFSDHERWSEEAEEKTRVGAVEAESGKRADAALRSARDGKGKGKSNKKAVAVVVNSESGRDSAYDSDTTYHSEHASILSHLPSAHDSTTTELFVLIYAPTLTSLPPLDYQPPSGESGLGSSYSQISTPVATPGSELQSISPRIAPSETSYPKSFNTLYQQALTLVSHSSRILPFTTQAGYVQILKHLGPQLVYVTEELSGTDGESVAQLRGWVGSTIVVAGEGLADTETEDEGVREKRRWYERSSMVGLGKEVEVVDAARVGEDWGKRVGGRE